MLVVVWFLFYLFETNNFNIIIMILIKPFNINDLWFWIKHFNVNDLGFLSLFSLDVRIVTDRFNLLFASNLSVVLFFF